MRTKEILTIFDENPIIVVSWGLFNLRLDGRNINFSVEGLQFQGDVIITTNDSESVNISFIKNGKKEKTMESISIAMMLLVLDSFIETGDDIKKYQQNC